MVRRSLRSGGRSGAAGLMSASAGRLPGLCRGTVPSPRPEPVAACVRRVVVLIESILAEVRGSASRARARHARSLKASRRCGVRGSRSVGMPVPCSPCKVSGNVAGCNWRVIAWDAGRALGIVAAWGKRRSFDSIWHKGVPDSAQDDNFWGGVGRSRDSESIGRGGGIRTPDPLVPNQMRYQTALRPDCFEFILETMSRFRCFFRTRYVLAGLLCGDGFAQPGMDRFVAAFPDRGQRFLCGEPRPGGLPGDDAGRQ